MAFLGLRSTADFTVAGQRPKNYREGLLFLYPNGDAPLTALTAAMRSEAVDDPEFNWYTKKLQVQAGTITGIYTDAGLATALAAAATDGQTLYVKMAAVDTEHFRVGHIVLLRKPTDYQYDIQVRVTAKTVNGANSYLTITTLRASNVGFNPTFANGVTRALVIGNSNAEGATIPNAISYDPVKWFNYTQIFRTPLEITRTAKKTRLRTGPAYKEAKREALEMHSIEMERAFIYGIPTEKTGSNGKPERTTGGLIWAINQGGTIKDYRYAGYGAAVSWLTKGQDFLDQQLKAIFAYGDKTKMAYVGNGAMLAINQLARANGQWEFTTSTKAYGISVNTLVCPFGTIEMQTHPLFSMEDSDSSSMLIFEPRKLKYRFIDDTMFYDDDGKHGGNRKDGQHEEFLTEAGMEFYGVEGWGYLGGLGATTVS